MNTLNRPLFRQMGGPAAMMPQDMAPPPQMGPPMPQEVGPSPEEQVMGVEQNAEEAGREYVASMMGGIDSAEDVTSMINALRGNDAPLESRYAELAGYVGEADASQTPESVLAMVQPTLMMTEEGAVDSGIGELMAGLSDSPMETPSGDPTAMGQGVGELMTMGAGSTPPVNFRNGGPVEVRGYAGQETNSSEVRPGGGSNLAQRAQKLYPDMQALYSSVLGSPEARAADLEEQKRLSKAQIFFDIAQTALAAGAPTATPMSAAERIAGAVGQTQLFDKMGQRSAGLLQAKQAQAAEDRQMRMAALTGSIGESTRQLGEESKVSLANVTAANEMTRLLADQSYRSGESALDRTGRLTLANNQIAANIALQKSGAANTIAEIKARGELQSALQKSQAGFTASLQNDRFTFTRGQDLNNNAHQTFLQQRQAENQKKLEALRFDNSKESAELQNRFVQENYKIQSELQLANRLEEMGASNAYDIGKMAKGQEYSIALQGNLSALQTVRQEDEQAHALAKQALAVAANKQEKLTTFAAQAALQKIAQEFTGSESEKTRALSKAKMMIDNAFRTEQLQISQGQLDVSEGQLDVNRMTLAVTKSYKAGMLAVEQAEAASVKLGSDALTKQINFITDPDRLTAYSTGTLDNTDQFETAVLKYVSDRAVFNAALGREEPIGTDLPPSVLAKIKQGNLEFYKKLVPIEPPSESTYFNPDAEAVVGDPILFLRDARKEILKPDGSVAFDSPIWEAASTDIFNPEIDYTQAIGFSRVVPGFKKSLAEGFAEIQGGVPGTTSAEARNLTEAAATLDSFATDLLQFKTDVADDRVLKFVQEKIEDTVSDIRSGGFFLKTDADARATLKTLKNSFAQSLRASAMLLPEYGGSAPMTATQTLTETMRMNKLKLILNEIIKFEKAFDNPPTIQGAGYNSGVVTDNSVQATTDFFNNLVNGKTNDGTANRD